MAQMPWCSTPTPMPPPHLPILAFPPSILRTSSSSPPPCAQTRTPVHCHHTPAHACRPHHIATSTAATTFTARRTLPLHAATAPGAGMHGRPVGCGWGVVAVCSLARTQTQCPATHREGIWHTRTVGSVASDRSVGVSVHGVCVHVLGCGTRAWGWQLARGRRWGCQAVLAHPHGTPRAHTTPVGCRTRHHGATSIRRPAPCTHLTHQPMLT